jgi:hypothetical protein
MAAFTTTAVRTSNPTYSTQLWQLLTADLCFLTRLVRLMSVQ